MKCLILSSLGFFEGSSGHFAIRKLYFAKKNESPHSPVSALTGRKDRQKILPESGKRTESRKTSKNIFGHWMSPDLLSQP